MRIWTEGNEMARVMFFAPEDKRDRDFLNDFARVDEPLVAVLKRGQELYHLHLEIRKENP